MPKQNYDVLKGGKVEPTLKGLDSTFGPIVYSRKYWRIGPAMALVPVKFRKKDRGCYLRFSTGHKNVYIFTGKKPESLTKKDAIKILDNNATLDMWVDIIESMTKASFERGQDDIKSRFRSLVGIR